MCFKKNIELNLNSFSTPSGSDPYPQPLRVHCRSSVPSLCLRSSFAPGDGQKATPKGLHSEATSTPKPACQSETDRYALQCNSSDLTTTASGKSKKNCQPNQEKTTNRYALQCYSSNLDTLFPICSTVATVAQRG